MNEQVFSVFILGTLLLTVLTISLGLFLLAHKRRQEQNKIEKQQLEFNYQNDLLQTRLEEQEKSMTLISEEIHDNIGQVLGLTKMNLYNVISYVEKDEGKAFGKIVEDLLTQAINDLRHISHSLNSDLLHERGLDSSLEREITYLQESTQIQCSFVVEGSTYPLAKEKNVLVFRIVQESLQNILKHADASHLALSLSYSPETLTIKISDDGKGFDTEAAKESNSLGLRNIRNRAKLLRADLQIDSHHGLGTTLVLKIPCNFSV